MMLPSEFDQWNGNKEVAIGEVITTTLARGTQNAVNTKSLSISAEQIRKTGYTLVGIIGTTDISNIIIIGVNPSSTNTTLGIAYYNNGASGGADVSCYLYPVFLKS